MFSALLDRMIAKDPEKALRVVEYGSGVVAVVVVLAPMVVGYWIWKTHGLVCVLAAHHLTVTFLRTVDVHRQRTEEARRAIAKGGR